MTRTTKVVIALAALSALAARLVNHVALAGMPHVMDEITYLFQAKLFANGELTSPVLEPRAAFNMWFIEDRGSRFGIFPPGWPALLSIGVRLGLASWVNPLLHGVTVFLLGRAGDRLGGARIAVLAALLYGASPQAVLLAASYMSHTLVAFAASVVAWFSITLLRDREVSLRLSFAAGAALGVTAATRPLCAVVLAVWLSSSVVLFGRARASRPLQVLASAALGGVGPVLGLFAFNRTLTGSVLRFPQMKYFDEHLAPSDLPFFRYRPGCNALGLGKGHGCDLTVHDAIHSLSNALSNTGDNLTAWLLLACGPFLVVGVVLAIVRRTTRRDALFLAFVPIATVALYALYWHGGTCYGARFYQCALPAALLLVALGLESSRRPRVTWGLLSAVMLWNAFAYVRVAREIADPVWGYWAIDDRFAKLRREWKDAPALVMVAFGRDDLYNPKMGWTAIVPDGAMWMLNIRALAALAENPVGIEGSIEDARVVFAKFHPALVDDLKARFPNRKLFLYVANGIRGKDTLEAFDPALFPSDTFHEPPQNFDGFRVGPPLLPPPPSLRPPDEENLYPRR